MIRRIWKYTWRTLALLVLAGLAYVAWTLSETSQLAVDISAKWACQCRYIDGGDAALCTADDPLPIDVVEFSFDADMKAVTADIWGMVSSTAEYRPGWGCMVE